MSDATRERVRVAIDRLHFSPSRLVRALRERRTHVIGLLGFGLAGIDGDIGDIVPPMLQGLVDRADSLGQEILIYTGWPQRRDRYSYLTFLDGHIDGLIWIAPGVDEPVLARLAEAGLPVLAVLTRHVPDGVGFVNGDNIAGMRLLIDHLVALGHRRIAFAGRPQSSNFIDRKDGYRAALIAHGIQPDPALEADYGWYWPEYECALDTWIAMDARPTAIVASDDALAMGAVASIRRRGLRVPQDIAVTGFNGLTTGADQYAGLTTIRQPFRSMAGLALERAVALIDSAPVAECRLILPVQLVVAESTAAQ